ncbi:unnamed protein product, partial [marine sediment metagenome]
RLNLVKAQKEIARQSILRSIEKDIADLLSRKCAKISIPSSRDFDDKEFRYVLDNEPSWKFIEDEDEKKSSGWVWSKYAEIGGERYWLVRECRSENDEGSNQYLSSRAFQETLLWFRRMLRAYQAGIICDEDLFDLWRFILPFGFAGRLQYFKKYFQGEEEIQSMVFIINKILLYCCNKELRRPVHYFRSYVTEEELEILTRTEEYKKLHQEVNEVWKT